MHSKTRNATLIVLAALIAIWASCSTTKTTVIETNQYQLCRDLNEIDSMVLQETSFLQYFNIAENSNVKYFRHKNINLGFPRSFTTEIADIRHQTDTSKSSTENYDHTVSELLKYQAEKKVLRYTCKENSIPLKDADFEISYWYNPIDSFYSIDIVRILKAPGHTQGYLFLTKKKMNEFEIIRRSYWTE